jgi:hypothetical protein
MTGQQISMEVEITKGPLSSRNRSPEWYTTDPTYQIYIYFRKIRNLVGFFSNFGSILFRAYVLSPN